MSGELSATSHVRARVLCLTTRYSVVCCYRRPGEPPVVKGHPIWGSAADFNQHAVNFLQHARKTYGSVFTIRLVNQYMTIIMDPHSFEPMSKERNFDFNPIQKQVNWNVFNFVLKEPKKVIKDTGRTVRGANLHRNMSNFIGNLNRAYDGVMPNEISQQNAWQTDGLRFFASRTLFNALFNTIFGRSDDHPFNSRAMYRNFEVFHKYFNYFWLGVPKKWFPPAMKALEGMLVQPSADELLQREDLSEYIKTAVSYMKMHGQTEADIMGHNLVYLHVNYNTFRLAFWALSYILEDEKVLNALMDEINNSIDDNRDENGTAAFSIKDIENMEVLGELRLSYDSRQNVELVIFETVTDRCLHLVPFQRASVRKLSDCPVESSWFVTSTKTRTSRRLMGKII